MKKHLLIGLLATTACIAQDQPGDRVTVPFTDPNGAKQLKVSLLNGSITIRGYDGKEAIVEARGSARRREKRDQRTDGLRRLDIFSSGLTVEEQNNVLRVGAGPHGGASLLIQVPVNTSVSASLVNGGDLIVENISGEIDVNNTNGGIKMSNISGTVVAHALNDNVEVKFDKVSPAKPMSFSSLNGDIDVTFPADMKAKLKMKSENGDIYSDFDIKLEPGAQQPVVEENRQKTGKYKVKFDRAMFGSINGGGQEVQLTTLNGKILIRKAK
jgi:DUF4097 and DUF4098 domain-containing protein YvlB